ncbi:polyprenol monophosphomannose synthase, partial [Bacteroidota bacterium]
PCYNEKENIEKILTAIFSLEKEFDILIIDDNSPDGTANIVKNLQKTYKDKLFIVERAKKLGLGTAYLTGFEWALKKDYEYIFEMDADFSHNPNDLIQLYKECAEKGADMSIGSRYIRGITVVNWPIGRLLISYFASSYVRMVTGLKIMDTTAGFKCYTRKVLKKIPFDKIKLRGYGFQVEMKFTAWKYGFKIVEVPVIFVDRVEGNSKMSGGIFSEALYGVILLKWRSLFRKYL